MEKNLCDDCQHFFKLKYHGQGGITRCLVINKKIVDNVYECNEYDRILKEGEIDPNPATIGIAENE